jgi:adenosylcobinamide-GDP ribazoletransferase
MKSLFAAIRFLTILPMPGDWGTAEGDLARSVPWFPAIGLLLGAIAAAAAWGLSFVAPPMVTSAVIVVILLSLSCCLHLDGLADSADGMLSSRPRERIL